MVFVDWTSCTCHSSAGALQSTKDDERNCIGSESVYEAPNGEPAHAHDEDCFPTIDIRQTARKKEETTKR